MKPSLPLKIIVICMSLALAGGYVAYRHVAQTGALPAAAGSSSPTISEEKREAVVVPGSKTMTPGPTRPINRNNIDEVLNNPNRGIAWPEAGSPASQNGPGRMPRALMSGSKSAIIEIPDEKPSPVVPPAAPEKEPKK